MDHELIDRALTQLNRIPEVERTPEMIQAWARFICAAAGTEIESTTRIYSEWVELRASAALLAAELEGGSYSVGIDTYKGQPPTLKVFIFTGATTALYGYGKTAEDALGMLREDAKLPPSKEAA
jgi:hypothetical protein